MFEFFDKLNFLDGIENYKENSNVQYKTDNKIHSNKQPTFLDFIIKEFIKNNNVYEDYKAKEYKHPLSSLSIIQKFRNIYQGVKRFISKTNQKTIYENNSMPKTQDFSIKIIENKVDIKLDKSLNETNQLFLLKSKLDYILNDSFTLKEDKNENKFSSNKLSSRNRRIRKKNYLTTSKFLRGCIR